MSLKSKKVLFLIPHPTFFGQLGGVGGHVSHVYGVISGLKENGYEVDIATGDGSQQLIEDGFNAVSLDASKRKNRLSFALSFLKLTKKMVNENQYDFVYMRYVTLFSPFISKLKRIISPLPLILEVNSFASQRYAFFRPIDRIVFSASDIIIAVSDMLYKDISKVSKKQDAKKILLLINGVNSGRFQCEPKPIFPKILDKIYVGYIGVLKPNYGIEELVDAQLINQTVTDNIETIIIGSGVIKGTLIERASNCDSIHFCDVIPFHEVPAIMRGLDVVVSTVSPKNKCGLSTKIFEYMSSERPIIVGRTKETEKLLKSGDEALFYTPGEAKDLANKIIELESNEKLRIALAMSALDKVINNHGWKSKIRTLLETINHKQVVL